MSDAVVGILVGSESDRERMQGALDVLDEAGIGYEFDVRSAHRTPDSVAEYARTARERGLRVLICGAGLAAALPGAVAAHTDLPVIGVPLKSSMSVLDGLDALLAIAQMPPGVPVATVGVDNARNAGALAVRILAHVARRLLGGGDDVRQRSRNVRRGLADAARERAHEHPCARRAASCRDCATCASSSRRRTSSAGGTAARDVRELGPLPRHRVVVDLRDRPRVLHARR